MEYLKQLIIYFSFILNPNKDNYYQKKYNAVMGDLSQTTKEEKIRRSFDGEVEPPFPDLVEDIKTVQGIDKNKNGVRDDIEIWINRKFKSSNHRLALKEYIRALNNIMMMEVRKNVTYDDLRKVYVEYQQASQCYFAVRNLDMSDYLKSTARTDLDNLFFNTYLRSKEYDSYSDRILTTQNTKYDLQKIQRTTNGNQILDLCKFKVENRELIYEKFPDYMKKE